MIKIKLTKKSNSKSGSSAVYVPLSSRTGIKVIKSSFFVDKCKYKTERELTKSAVFRIAKVEEKLLRRVSRSGLSPKGYGVRPVKLGNFFYAGIKMQHIPGKRLRETGKNLEILEASVEQVFRTTGLRHTDDHLGNFILWKNKGYLLDFDPQYIEGKYRNKLVRWFRQRK